MTTPFSLTYRANSAGTMDKCGSDRRIEAKERDFSSNVAV
jgi:hypothetical protein